MNKLDSILNKLWWSDGPSIDIKTAKQAILKLMEEEVVPRRSTYEWNACVDQMLDNLKKLEE